MDLIKDLYNGEIKAYDYNNKILSNESIDTAFLYQKDSIDDFNETIYNNENGELIMQKKILSL
jgi:hypothetical protein